MPAARLPTLLVVDPDPAARRAVAQALADGFDLLEARDAAEALPILEDEDVQAVFCGMLPDAPETCTILSRVRNRWPAIGRIAMIDAGAQAAVAARLGEISPQQVLTRPCPGPLLRVAAQTAVAAFDLAREHDRLRLEVRCLSNGTGPRHEVQRRRLLRESDGFDRILRAPDSPMGPLLRTALQFASFDVPVLIRGEQGTGKDTLARAIHGASLRSDRPFQNLTCPGLTDDLIEAELFGSRRATGARPGLVARAEGGTLFLDGVHMLGPRLQLALLRLLRDRQYVPAGGTEVLTAQVRVLTGSSADLAAEVEAGRFREDLYYALSVTELTLPPLRDRPRDIPLIATQFLFDAATAHGKPVRGFDDAALDCLAAYDWPGNLRELANEVTRMLIFSQDSVLGADLISRHILTAPPQGAEDEASLTAALALAGPLKDRVETLEKRIIRETLIRRKWNKSRAAADLGLSRVGLRAKLDRYGITPPLEAAHEKEEA